jgi:hypothetical protein
MQFDWRAVQMSWRSLQAHWRSFHFNHQSLPKVAMALFSIAILGSIGAVLSKVLAPRPAEVSVFFFPFDLFCLLYLFCLLLRV